MHTELTTFQLSDGSLAPLILSNVSCGGGKHDEDNGNDTHDDEDNNCLGKAGDADCNRGDSKGEVVDSGVSGVNNKSADELPELESVHGVLGKLYANSGSDNNDLLLNGDKGFLDSSSGGDSDRGVRDGNDDGLNSDGKALSNGMVIVKVKL